jgi:hypothetical protein
MSEVWKPIKGFEDCGQISDTGRIKGKYGKIRKTFVSNNGYERVGLYGGDITVGVHRLVAMTFCDGYQDGLVVNHKDGDKLNNAANNLEWVTQSENVIHAFENNMRVAPRANLIVPDADIEQIIQRRANGETYQSIADDYGVTSAAISHRLRRMKEAKHCLH